MLKIRLQRVGKRNQPFFRLVLVPSENKVKGKVNEILGSYNPRSKDANFNQERINYWQSKGAQFSDTAWNLLIKKGILKAKKRAVKIKVKKGSEEEAKKAAA